MSQQWTFPAHAVELWDVPSYATMSFRGPQKGWYVELRRDEGDIFYAECYAPSVRDQTAKVVVLNLDVFESKRAAMAAWKNRVESLAAQLAKRLDQFERDGRIPMKEMEERETYTRIRAIGTVQTKYGTASITASDVLSSTAMESATIDLEAFSKDDLARKITEAARREGATVISIEYEVEELPERPRDGEPQP